MTAPRPLVEINNLSKHYPLGTRLLHKPDVVRAVDGVSLQVWPGQSLGLVGESGCGKSTLGRAVLRLVEPTAGQVVIAGTDVTALPRGELRRFRRQAQMIFQDPYSSLNPRMNVQQILGEPLRIHRLCSSPAEERERAAQLLDQVGLPAASLSRYPHEFSGGQRQRIGIARALAVQPRFIVADEPVSALDVSIQAQIINLLRDIQAQQGLTYLFISHDLKVVEHMCDQVAVMYLGRLCEVAATEPLYYRPRHPYTQALLAAIPAPPESADYSPDNSGNPDPAASDPSTPTPAAREEAPAPILSPSRRPSRLLLVDEAPSLLKPPSGCAFHPRCARYAGAGSPAVCRTQVPVLRPIADGQADAAAPPHHVACHLA
jgi:ABC-type oligopeptide transport system ATPase subunit